MSDNHAAEPAAAATASAIAPTPSARGRQGRHPSANAGAARPAGEIEDDLFQARAGAMSNAIYHTMRRGQLETMHRLLMAVVVLSGSAAFAGFGQFGGAAAALAGTLDLLLDLNRKAEQHAYLQREYYEVLADLEVDKGFEAAEVRMHRLSAQERPIYHVVHTVAFNRAMRALDAKHELIEVARWRRFFGPFFRFENWEIAGSRESDERADRA